ncbi:peptidyl-tRNA hydrolase domain-containing protein 1 [Rhizophlyctis rosea]|uniref:peptidyl-tRNA hydrolase n=1 Tax=Rhizophlyctis rosea TaxID=64517 RepID=A0AAD5S1G0_9FUNG|nr:peptidyl-tRNA hydrolase domain-containing protein 1 [Rhizophlyctis rosea]
MTLTSSPAPQTESLTTDTKPTALLSPPTTEQMPLTMFVVIRKDLAKTLSWPAGSVITQACHATAAVLHLNKDNPDVQQYLKDWKGMTKVSYEVKNETALRAVADKLTDKNIPYHMWVEQPENIITCLATVPIRKDSAGDAFKKCSLYR